MNERLFVRPKEGVIIRHPKSKAIMPESGFWIVLDRGEGKYWRRRLACGDIVVISN